MIPQIKLQRGYMYGVIVTCTVHTSTALLPAATQVSQTLHRKMERFRQAPNVNTPKGASAKIRSDHAGKKDELKKSRRRLSVISDNQLIEGVQGVVAQLEEKTDSEVRLLSVCVHVCGCTHDQRRAGTACWFDFHS
jgi:hypothetical protein